MASFSFIKPKPNQTGTPSWRKFLFRGIWLDPNSPRNGCPFRHVGGFRTSSASPSSTKKKRAVLSKTPLRTRLCISKPGEKGLLCFCHGFFIFLERWVWVLACPEETHFLQPRGQPTLQYTRVAALFRTKGEEPRIPYSRKRQYTPFVYALSAKNIVHTEEFTCDRHCFRPQVGNQALRDPNSGAGVAFRVWIFKGSLKDTFCNHLKHVAFSTKMKGHHHLQVAMFRCIM